MKLLQNLCLIPYDGKDYGWSIPVIRETTEERARERWRRTLDLFEQALAQTPERREEFLNSACSGDTLLRRTVKEMIESHARAETENFMETPAWSYSPPNLNPREMIGQQVGSYRLTQFIDQGGMGVIYLAEPADGFFRRQAAVKLIRADLDPKQYRRFRREAQILADLKHPNLVFLYEAGRMADGRPYLAMEYVEGENLRDWLQSRGLMPLAMIVEVMKQACAGVGAAHTAGVIHRDIKPGNIVFSENGGKLSVKVLDFGIAARMDSSGSEISGAHDVIGTLPYMSPEQLQARKGYELTPASDVYSLGLTVYELLTGRRAITGNSPAEIISKHMLEMPVPPSHIRQDLDMVDRVIMKALAKEPEARYQSASEFAAALEAASLKPEPSPIPQPHPPLPPSPKLDWKKYARAIAATAAVVAGLLATYLVRMNMRDPAPNSGQTQQTITPTPTQPNQGKPLKVQLDVKNPSGLRHDGCGFALYKSDVQAIPERTTRENAHVIIIGIGSKGVPQSVNYESVTPGNYMVKFACEGFKTFSEKVSVAEDPKYAGYATISVPLERK